MKRNIATILIAYIFLLVSCESEPDYVRTYPQLLSTELVSNTPTGVTVRATMSEALMSKITDHGFTWIQTGVPQGQQVTFTKSLGKPSGVEFSAEITSQLFANKDYIIKAFLKTDANVVYGVDIPFKSQGSRGPVIESMSPAIVAPTDLLTIKGSGFGNSLANTIVKLVGKTSVTAQIKTITDNEMVVEVPQFYDETVNVSVTVPGTSASLSTISVSRKLPKLTGITSADLCSPIVINGEDLLTFGNFATVTVTVNNRQFSSTPPVTANSITLPADVHAPKLNVKVTFRGGYAITMGFNDPAKQPAITGGLPSTIFKGESFVLTGTDFPGKCGQIEVSSDKTDTHLTISKVTGTEITVLASTVGCTPFKVNLKFRGASIYLSEPVTPGDFTATSIGPDIGKIGDPVYIYGTNLSDMTVTMGDFPFNDTKPGASVLLNFAGGDLVKQHFKITAPEIIDNLPRTPEGVTTITVSRCDHHESFWYKLEVPDFTITDWVQKSTSPPATGVINGTNFPKDIKVIVLDVRTKLYAGDLLTKSITATQIEFYTTGYGVLPPDSYILGVEWLGRRKLLPVAVKVDY